MSFPQSLMERKRAQGSVDELGQVKMFMKTHGGDCKIIALHNCLPDNIDDYEKYIIVLIAVDSQH
jgi:hypothetical protein